MIKTAICTFTNRICHRFDMTQKIIILNGPSLAEREEIDASSLSPEESLDLLIQKGIGNLIVGGIQDRYRCLLLDNRVQVISGVIGEVEDVVQAYAKGDLYSGIDDVTSGKKKRGGGKKMEKEKLM